MYIEHNPEFMEMMNGGFGEFNQYELWTIILNQNDLHINVLKIQQTIDKTYICKVDDITVNAYRNKRRSLN